MEPDTTPLEASAELLQILGEFLQGLTPRQLDDILSRKVKITISRSRDKSEVKERPHGSSLLYADLRRELSGAASREEGALILERAALNKAGLLEMARELDIPVPKSEKVDQLGERIIEATIGYRLRSDAIQGAAGSRSEP